MPMLWLNGFEDDFGSWDGNIGPTVIDTVWPHHGAKCLKATNDDKWQTHYAYKTLPDLEEVFIRFYVSTSTLPTAWATHNFFKLWDNESQGDADRIVVLKFRESAGSTTYDIECVSWGTGSDVHYYTSSIPLTAHSYLCVEIQVVRGTTDGEIRVWVDGVLEIEQTNIDTDRTTAYTGFGVGANSDGSEAETNYIDCVAYSDRYIGPEVNALTLLHRKVGRASR